MSILDLPSLAGMEPTDRQREVLDEIERYNEATGEGASISYLARRLDLHRTTIHQHVVYLRRKGFLKTSGSPAIVLQRH